MTIWKHRAPFIALALITIGLSSWGLFHLFHDFADMPWGFACLVVGGLDLFAVVCGGFAVMVSGDGDSPVGWNLLLVLYTAAAAYAQFTHAQLAGDPPVIGWLMAAFPLATVLLFEGQLRRAARLDGRARGTVAPPRRRVPLLVWARFPVESWHAYSDAIRALGHLEPPRPAPVVELVVDEVKVTRPPQTVRPLRQNGQSVQASAAAAADRLDSRDTDAVWAEVQRTTHPDVSRDTVRKSLSRIPTNGYTPQEVA